MRRGLLSSSKEVGMTMVSFLPDSEKTAEEVVMTFALVSLTKGGHEGEACPPFPRSWI